MDGVMKSYVGDGLLALVTICNRAQWSLSLIPSPFCAAGGEPPPNSRRIPMRMQPRMREDCVIEDCAGPPVPSANVSDRRIGTMTTSLAREDPDVIRLRAEGERTHDAARAAEDAPDPADIAHLRASRFALSQLGSATYPVTVTGQEDDRYLSGILPVAVQPCLPPSRRPRLLNVPGHGPHSHLPQGKTQPSDMINCGYTSFGDSTSRAWPSREAPGRCASPAFSRGPEVNCGVSSASNASSRIRA